MRNAVERVGGNAIFPYLARRYRYVENLPYSVIDPSTKLWVRQAAALRYQLPPHVVNVKRTAFEVGTGIYSLMKLELQKQYPEIGKSANKIVSFFCGNRDMRPVIVGTNLEQDMTGSKLEVIQETDAKESMRYWGGRKILMTVQAMQNLKLKKGKQTIRWCEFELINVKKNPTAKEIDNAIR